MTKDTMGELALKAGKELKENDNKDRAIELLERIIGE